MSTYEQSVEYYRSILLWIVSWLHFLIAVPILIALAVVGPAKTRLAARGL
jgi:hypothetical protein